MWSWSSSRPHPHIEGMGAAMQYYIAPEAAFAVRAFDTGHVVLASGEIDFANAPEFAEVLAQFSNGDVIVDFSGVTFMDSSGLSVLLSAHRRFARRDAHLRLVAVPKRLLRTMQIAGLTGVLYLGRDRALIS
jgi:anti-anti-sigma factor